MNDFDKSQLYDHGDVHVMKHSTLLDDVSINSAFYPDMIT